MDINGTKFHLKTGKQDWAPLLERSSDGGLWWDRERAALSLRPKILRFPQRPEAQLLSSANRRGAAFDCYGNIFWISEDEKAIFFLSAGTNKPGLYWPEKDPGKRCDPQSEGRFHPLEKEEAPSKQRLCGLAVTERQYLVVGTVDPSGLLVFDLHAGGPPTALRWPEETLSPPQSFRPFDMTPTRDGGLLILEGDPEAPATHYWHLDRFFRVVSLSDSSVSSDVLPGGDFEAVESPSDEANPCTFPGGVFPEQSFALPVAGAVAIEALPDRTVLILSSPLDSTWSVIYRFYNNVQLDAIHLEDGLLDALPDDGRIKAHDFVFVPDREQEEGSISGELTLVAEGGNQAFVFGLVAGKQGLSLSLRPRYLPLRRYSGKALIGFGREVYYDLEERWLPLRPQPRQRFAGKGEIAGIVLDGKEPDCVWHRLMLDACIPDGARIEIETRSSNEEGFLHEVKWFKEPSPILRSTGSEIPFHQPFTEKELKHDGMGTWELLFQKAKGRFLELRLGLNGNEQKTPRIRAMRVYYPRFSYLERYLPATYRDEEKSAAFLDRFLANVEGFYTATEGRIAKAEALFDVGTTPPAYLEWLSGWLGAVLDPEWDDHRRRLFLSHALLLYRWRGTQIGLRAAIRLAIDPCPDASLFDELKGQYEDRPGTLGGRSVRIVEDFLSRKFPGVVLGDSRELEGPGMTPVTELVNAPNGEEAMSKGYRDFLRRSYGGKTEKETLEKIKAAWDEDLDSFDEIRFFTERPSQSMQSKDWVRFVRQEMAVSQKWTPALGAEALDLRFQAFLHRRYSEVEGEGAAPLLTLNGAWQRNFETFNEILFSPVLPALEPTAKDWRDFIRQGIGFTYAEVAVEDKAAYQEFLARRYRSVEALNLRYGLVGARKLPSFSDIQLPKEDLMPEDGPPLLDWIQFVSLALPITRNAHRFTVLVPSRLGELPEVRRQRMDKVRTIVKQEKPAHTHFDVKLYWALFQVGGARLGMDSVLGEGSRFVSLVLGANYLGQTYLESPQPWNVPDRQIVGRDPLMRLRRLRK